MTISLPPRALERAPATGCAFPLETEADVSLVGGKARALGRLMRGGLPVPAGVVITTHALDRFLDANGLRERIAATNIRRLVCEASMPESLRDEILHGATPLLRDGPVVVRSSAVGEDSASGSFAGQHDSFLHVSDAEALLEAVRNCWASYWSERAIAYRLSHPSRAGMAVVLQRQVPASLAGVMFTDAGAGRMLVEFGDGLADALVSGSVDPARLVIDRDSAQAHLLATGETSSRAIQALSAPHAVRLLLDAARDIENVFGAAQDVEWAMDQAGRLWIVQSRPITAPVVVPVPPERGASEEPVVWSNANISENYPTPVTPLLYSVAGAGYSAYFRNLARAFGIARHRIVAMEPAFSQIIGAHGARLYYNLSSIHGILRMAPFGGALASSFDTFVGSGGQAPAPAERNRRSELRDVAELAVIAVKTAWLYLSLGRRIARFERTVDAFAARMHPRTIAAQSPDALRDALREFMEIRCHRWTDASLADAAAMVCYGALERVVRGARLGEDADALHTALLKAIPNVISGEPVKWLWRLSRQVREDPALHALFETGDAASVLRAVYADDRFAGFRKAFDEYLEVWGFRCSSELMLTVPSFQEAPEPLVEMLRSYARIVDGSPDDALRREAADRETLMRAALRAARLRDALALRVLVPWTHAAIRYRERARHRQALLYARLRRVALAAGERLAAQGRLATSEDVFWLTISELQQGTGTTDQGRGKEELRDLVATRRQTHAIESAVIPPDTFVLPRGAHYVPAVAAGEGHDASAAAPGTMMRGTSACAGTVTGPATVLSDVTEAARLAPGDVLVTRQTDPGWAPVFFLISGLVIERGGMLSHGAIVAREFGIPCVVGVKDATRRLADGARLLVDGDRGEIHVLS